MNEAKYVPSEAGRDAVLDAVGGAIKLMECGAVDASEVLKSLKDLHHGFSNDLSVLDESARWC